jgi:hypothetical protein
LKRLSPLARTVLVVAANVLGVVVIFSLVELGLALSIRVPPSHWAFRDALDAWYMDWERSIVQYEPACARYDPLLSYTLRPGRCRFANREFDVELRINSLGVRDDETALAAPEIVVLGDSFAMGWGVAQEQAFPQRLARLTGRRVLNTGVSSYGTARELELLRRVDTKAMSNLVIQYSDNDELENRFAVTHGHQLEIMPQDEYERIAREHNARIPYFPGKYLLYFVPLLRDTRFPPRPAEPPPPHDPESEVDVFLQTLSASQVDLSRVQVVVFELNGHNHNDDDFARRLALQLTRPDLPDFVRRLRTLEVGHLLTPDDYFFYDDHLNERGHEKIARALVNLVAQPERQMTQ